MKAGGKVTYVDEAGAEFHATVTKVYPPESPHTLVDLTYVDANGNTVVKTSVSHNEPSEDAKNHWH